VSGLFDSDGQGTPLSKAAVFWIGRVPVVGRFSLGGGNHNVGDAPDTIRGLGLLFRCPMAKNGGRR
jgi:catalase